VVFVKHVRGCSLAAGLILAVLTGVALYGVAQQSAARPEAPAATNTVPVLVAKADIAARTVLSADLSRPS